MARGISAPPDRPGFDNDLDQERLSSTLRVVFGANLLGLAAYTLLAPIEPSVRILRLVVAAPIIGLILYSELLVRRGALRQASLITVVGMSIILALTAITNGGVRALAYPALLVIVVMAGLLLGRRAAIAVAGFSIAVGLGTATLGYVGLVNLPAPIHSDTTLLLAYTGFFLLIARITALTMDGVRLALERAHSELRERRAAVVALRASEEQFARAFRFSPVGLAIMRMSDGVIRDVNAAFCAMSGRRREELVGRSVADIHMWVYEEQRRQLAQVLAHQGRLRDVEYQFRRPDKSLGTALLSAELIDFGGDTCALAASLDLTAHKRAEDERRRLETQMLQAQKLESLGLMASGIAHDFNNLMTSVLGSVDMALIDAPSDNSLRPRLVAIEQAARSASDLCGQLMIYAGHGQLRVEPVDLGALVREMSGLVQISAGRNVAMSIELPALLPLVAAEASQLRQVVLNLVTNAAEASGERGGAVRVRVSTQEFDPAALRRFSPLNDLAPGRYVVLTVADNGVGMDQATLSQIFDPFFTTKPHGHGLGLAAVQGIVRRHGGAIDVHSAPGQGSEFTVLLPIVDLAQPRAPGAEAGPGWSLSGLVLVVDDEEAVRTMAERMLERQGMAVLLASSGSEALAIYRERFAEIALVLLDLAMPGLDGAATLAELRRIGSTPVLLASGYSQRELGSLPLDASTAFIQKPYRAPELNDKIRSLLRAGE